jgi:hypothetical protein
MSSIYNNILHNKFLQWLCYEYIDVHEDSYNHTNFISFQGSLCKGLGFDVLLHVFVYTRIWISFLISEVFIFPGTMKHDLQILMFCDPFHETIVNSGLSTFVCKKFWFWKLETSRFMVLHYCLRTQMLLVIGLTPK